MVARRELLLAGSAQLGPRVLAILISWISISKYQETRLLQRSSVCFTCKQGLANFPRYETVEQARYGEFDEAAIDSNCLFRHFFSRTVPMQSIVSFLIADALYCKIRPLYKHVSDIICICAMF